MSILRVRPLKDNSIRMKRLNIERVAHDMAAVERLSSLGYEVVDEPKEQTLDDLTVADLREIAAEKGITNASRMKKDELIQKIEDA